MLSRILALMSSPLLSLWLAAPAPAPTDSGPPTPAVPSGHAPAPAPSADEVAPSAPQVNGIVDVVLPCGLRVITARDASLPVAAVVLAIEVGTRDDPDKLPGLVHALAYHLQQGNRELAPGEAIATAHDAGGIAGMAVGAAQVRFESLVPISSLDAQLRVEALRLQAPNTGRELWIKSLSYARSDDAVKLLVPREAIAAAWQDAGLAHDGRQVPRALGDLLDQAVGAQLARFYDYRLATLVVVGPDDPQALLARIEPLFSGLPARPRKQIAKAETPPAPTAAPALVRVPKQKGDSMLWAVAGDPRSRAWAQVLCGTLNRQARRDDEPAKARVRCTYEDDPRRPILLLRAIGFDPASGPEPLIAKRLDRIAAVASDAKLEPELAALVESMRARIETDLRFDLRTPLDLATYLASMSERSGPAQVLLREHDEALGLPMLPASAQQPVVEPAPAPAPIEPASGKPAPGKPAGKSGDKHGELPTEPPLPPRNDAAIELLAAVPALFDTRRAVLLLDPEQAAPPPLHPPAASVGEPASSAPAAATPTPGGAQ